MNSLDRFATLAILVFGEDRDACSSSTRGAEGSEGGADPVRSLAATAAGTGPDSAVAVAARRPPGPSPWPQSHGHGTPTRLLQLEEAGRDGHGPRAAEWPGVCRVASAAGTGQAVSVRVGRRLRGQPAPATCGLRCCRGRGPRAPFLECRVMLQITPQMKILVAVE